MRGAPLQILKVLNAQVRDLGPLRGAPLEELDLLENPVSDLSPLSDCRRLHKLDLTRTSVSDLSPILGLNLIDLHISTVGVQDVSPLASCSTLTHLVLPREAKGIEALRHLPHLERISFEYDSGARRVAQSAAEFLERIRCQKAGRAIIVLASNGLDDTSQPPRPSQRGVAGRRLGVLLREVRAVHRGFAQKQGLDEHAARDTLQETMLLLMRKLPTFTYDSQRGRFPQLALAIVANKCVRRSGARPNRAARIARCRSRRGRATRREPAVEAVAEEELEKSWRQSLLEEALRRLLYAHAPTGKPSPSFAPAPSRTGPWRR